MKNLPYLAVILAVASAWAHGEGKGDGGAMRQACGADAERLCPGSPNPGICLHEHWDQVSPECKEFKENMRRRWQAKNGEGSKPGEKQGHDGMRRACGADVDRFCAGSPRPGMCLHEHWDELSPACRQFKEGMKRRQNAQAPDSERPEGEMRRKPRVEWRDKRKEAPDRETSDSARP